VTHQARRLARRKVARSTPPSGDDLKRYAKLVETARKASLDPAGDTKPMARARKGVRGRSMPKGQAVAGSPFDRLCRLADRWPSMLGTARLETAAALAALVAECAAVLRAQDDAPLLARERADVNG